ncbi:membrane-bound lytic murein transglycosylase B [Natronocella acetinitrilica]|uniref:Membrane-bound lytic murein transglycosylase B n=1 Tax=Natronocella acetinitrilica TaxID=414046 RepID=A0AAE3G4T6_9GAMM|nr:lytic murein transglycosylase [Natronocella acetinitrilica]MCP1675377.1 membrane-bound lytic murein transglycosylase B [Natronocella acetinitrilica]
MHPVLRSLLLALLFLPFTVTAEEFRACVDRLADQAAGEGISVATIDGALRPIERQVRVVELDRRQPEFVQTFWQYYAARVSDTRLETGRERLEEYRPLLERVHADYGVRPEYLVSLWGLETNFGSHFGSMPVLDSLGTLACDPRRARFFGEQLMAALRLIDAGHMAPEQMRGSWAGAMGHMQFMPATFERHAVDATGDGRSDPWQNLEDALATGANYLRNMGWRDGERWGREVSLPDDFDYGLADIGSRRPLAEWADLGVRRVDGGALPQADMEAAMLLPAGHRGPAFLVYHNFHVIMRWNTSTSYALAVGLLADQLSGQPGLQTSEPADSDPLRRDDVEELQQRLADQGFDPGPVDGILGRQTRAAVRAFQRANDLPADGYPDPRLLEQLRTL